MEQKNGLDISPDDLIQNAVDTIRERITDDDLRDLMQKSEDDFISSRTGDAAEDAQSLEAAIASNSAMWPMRLYLADLYLQMGEQAGFEREVGECLARSADPFVVVSLFMFMTRLFVMRAKEVADAVRYVRETLENNPSVAPYIRTIYIQTLLEAGDFEETFYQLQEAVEERNPMLTIEGLEILPMLMARLGRWKEADQVVNSLTTFAKEQLTDNEQFELVRNLVVDVREREQLSDIDTARFLLRVATDISDEHPDVIGYESIATQIPNLWPPVQ